MAKKLWCSSSLLLTLFLCAGMNAGAQVQPGDFRYLNRLEGNWLMHTRQSTFRETWRRLNDSCWQGQNWRVVGKDSTLMEVMQLVRTSEGIFYIPDIEGQPVRFKLRVLKPIGFVAENLANDFPQKVRYRWKDDTHLDVRIEGKQEKTYSEIIFQYEKE